MVSAIIYLYRWLSKLIKRGGKVMEERYQNWLEATKFKLSKPKFSLSGGIALRPFQLLAFPPVHVERHGIYFRNQSFASEFLLQKATRIKENI